MCGLLSIRIVMCLLVLIITGWSLPNPFLTGSNELQPTGLKIRTRKVKSKWCLASKSLSGHWGQATVVSRPKLWNKIIHRKNTKGHQSRYWGASRLLLRSIKARWKGLKVMASDVSSHFKSLVCMFVIALIVGNISISRSIKSEWGQIDSDCFVITVSCMISSASLSKYRKRLEVMAVVSLQTLWFTTLNCE